MVLGQKTLDKKADETRNPKESLEDEIFNIIFDSNKQVNTDNIAPKIVLSGENGLGKTSLALSLLTNDMAEDEAVVYVGVDNSGGEIIRKFFKDKLISRQILEYNPDATKINDTGASVKDEERVLDNVTSTAAAIKKAIDSGIKVKGVIVDGISFILQFCESKMRLERNIAPDGGTPTHIWKIRAKAFRDFTSAYMSLDIPVIFISHKDFIPELIKPDENFASIKERLLDECGVRIVLSKEKSPDNVHVEYYIAEIKKNRSDLFTVGKTVTFMSANNEEDVVETNYKELKDLIFPIN